MVGFISDMHVRSYKKRKRFKKQKFQLKKWNTVSWTSSVGKTGFVVVQSPSRVQLFVTSKDCSMPGLHISRSPRVFPVHVHWVSDAIQPSHPLSSPSPPAFSLSQHQGLFQRVRFSHHWCWSAKQYSGLTSFRISRKTGYPVAKEWNWTFILHHAQTLTQNGWKT